MKKANELNYKDLRVVCNPNQFEFESTDELDPIDTGIGQDRGIKALEFGLNVEVKVIIYISKVQAVLVKLCILKII